MRPEFDFVVIGAGIAGASVAANLVPGARVLLAEMENAPGYHTTGRSAALFSKTYGPPPIRALSRASEAFFLDPGDGFASHPILSHRGTLFVARPDQMESVSALEADLGPDADVTRLTPAELHALCPLLRESYMAGGLLDDSAQDIDVDALHRGYLRRFARDGGELRCNAPVRGLIRDGAGWIVELGDDSVRAGMVINAAGAWADGLGALAGAAPIGLVPKRRSAAIIAAPDGFDPSGMRMVVDIDEAFYLKPEAGKLLISPADETPSPACDAQPEEIDIAIAVDRVETAFDLQVRRIEHKWAGLRSFVADKCPVVGFDPAVPGFFWLAGQGGYGIQSAPALGRVAAALATGGPVPGDILDQGFDPAATSPARAMAAA
jgi:D-arginine dehydrogenase